MVSGAARRPGVLPAVRFPRRAPPELVRYADPRVPTLALRLGELELVPYSLQPGEDGATAAALVRLGLLKRLESGSAALRRSAMRQLAFLRSFLAALESRRLVRPGRMPGTKAGGDQDPLQLVLLPLMAEPWPPGIPIGPARRSAHRDLERLEQIVRILRAPDPKLAALARLLPRTTPEKVIVFTEFRDTASRIWRTVAPEFRAARIDGSGAWLGARPASRRVVVEKFAPGSNGAPAPPSRERVDVLVATDVLAEGVNLQDARHVVSYDLPWNPVRLLQRIGRIDRLGSPHDVVYPYLFVPDQGVEELLGVTRRLRAKLGTIATVMGADDAEALLESLAGGSAVEVDRALHRVEADQQEPMERIRDLWERHPDLPRDPRPTPVVAQLPGSASTPGRPGSELPQAVILILEGDRFEMLQVGRDDSVAPPGSGAASLLERAVAHGTGARCPVDVPHATRLAELAVEFAATLRARSRAPGPLRSTDPCLLLGRRIRMALAEVGDWLDHEGMARIDRTLRTLSEARSDAVGDALGTVLDGLTGSESVTELADQVEQALARGRPAAEGAPPEPPVRPRVVALLMAESDSIVG
jgi:hypothetical protein